MSHLPPPSLGGGPSMYAGHSVAHSALSADVGVAGQLFESPELRRKNLIFAILVTFLQIAFCFFYGFLFRVPAQQMNITSIVTMIFLGLLVTAGFGLVFGYTKRLVWTGIGFNFFIMVFCIIYYPLINAFWLRTRIQQDNVLLDFDYSRRITNLVLTQRDNYYTNEFISYGNNLGNALKAALTMVVAFSCIIGRAGQLEALIVCLVGVIGFELNRQIVQDRASDTFGTMIIFTFGGFMGLVLGLFCHLRERKDQTRIIEMSLRRYGGEQHSVLFSCLGALIIFITFPFLAYEIDAYVFQSTFAPYTSTYFLLMAMAAGIVGSLLVSLLLNGYVIPRDVIHGLIAGAVIAGNSTTYFYNVVYAILTGLVGGMIQAFIQNLIEQPSVRRGFIVSSVSWTLFGVQGFLGACFAAGWKQLANNKYSSNFSNVVLQNKGEQFQVYIMLISAGIGAGFGIIAGILIYLTNFQYNLEYFEDSYYWRNSDGIRPLIRKVVAKPMESQDGEVYMDFEEGQEELNNRHAYL